MMRFLPRDWKRSRVAIVNALLHVGTLVSVMMRCLHHDWKRSHVAMLLGCTADALVLPLLLALTWPELVEPLELWTVDVRFQHRPPLPVSRESLQERPETHVASDHDDLADRIYTIEPWHHDQ